MIYKYLETETHLTYQVLGDVFSLDPWQCVKTILWNAQADLNTIQVFITMILIPPHSVISLFWNIDHITVVTV